MKTTFQRFSRTLACAGLISFFNAITAQSGIVAFNYDLAGRLTKSEFAANKSINYTYDPAGNLLQRAITTSVVNPDSDGDGMDDAWETLYFGNKDARDGSGDFDLDGAIDVNEFLAGTIPTNSASVLKVIPPPAISVSGATIQWSSVSGKTYRLQFKNSLGDTPWTNVPGDVLANSATASKLDSTASGQDRRYYRVLLQP